MCRSLLPVIKSNTSLLGIINEDEENNTKDGFGTRICIFDKRTGSDISRKRVNTNVNNMKHLYPLFINEDQSSLEINGSRKSSSKWSTAAS